MIGKLKLGAIIVVATLGVASPAFAEGGSTATGPNGGVKPHHTQQPSGVRHPVTGKLLMHHPITGKMVAQPNKKQMK
jgi:hypothetical protein